MIYGCGDLARSGHWDTGACCKPCHERGTLEDMQTTDGYVVRICCHASLVLRAQSGLLEDRDLRFLVEVFRRVNSIMELVDTGENILTAIIRQQGGHVRRP